MRTLILLLIAAVSVWPQCGRMVMNPSTGRMDCVGPAGVNAQTGTSYAILSSDLKKLITLTNGAAIAVSIAPPGSGFPDGWETWALNSGVGTATITVTPATATIEGAATLVLTTGQSARIVSNGTNYRAIRVVSAADAVGGAAALPIGNLNALTKIGPAAGGIVPSAVSDDGTDVTITGRKLKIGTTQVGVGHTFGASFDGGGGALTTGKTGYIVIPFACTISAWNIAIDAGTATVDVWKVATGPAIPSVTNVITGTGAGRPAISTGTAIHSTTLTGWSTVAVAANDIVAINLQAVANATLLVFSAQCDQ